MNIKVGDHVPDITSNDQAGNVISLKDFLGKKVVLYFYPKDDTPGCTAEACNLRDNFEVLKQKGIIVIGVSTDDEKSHQKFIHKYKLPFILLADKDKKIVTEFGLWGEKKFIGKTYMGTTRATFLINEMGVVEHVISKVDTKNHTKQIMEIWEIS